MIQKRRPHSFAVHVLGMILHLCNKYYSHGIIQMMMMMMKYEDEHEDNQAGSMMVRMMKIESPGSY